MGGGVGVSSTQRRRRHRSVPRPPRPLRPSCAPSPRAPESRRPRGAGCPGPGAPLRPGSSGGAEPERRGAPAGSRAGGLRGSPRQPPRGGEDRDLRVRAAGPHPAPRDAASGAPDPARGPAGPAAPRVPGSPGLPRRGRRRRSVPGRGAALAAPAARRAGGGRAAAGPLGRRAGFLHCLNSAPPASPAQGHSRPRSRPRPAAARPSVSLTGSTHPAGAPRSGSHTRRRSRLPGFCIRSHARSDTDPVPPRALPSSSPTPLSGSIPCAASALCCLAPQPTSTPAPPILHLP
nr:uncharacterized protein LOC110561613 [Meriones unguiculatus]